MMLDQLPDHYHLLATAMAPQAGRYRITMSAYAVGTQGKPLTMAMLCRPCARTGAGTGNAALARTCLKTRRPVSKPSSR